jgi:hypothetical protein
MAAIISEITVAPGTTTPQFDLLVTSTEPIRLTAVTNDGSTTPAGVTAFSSAANDSIVVSSTAAPTTFFYFWVRRETIFSRVQQDARRRLAGVETILF